MALSVYSAFEEFLACEVRLNNNLTVKARLSRDNLISNINAFSRDEDFFCLALKHNLKFGSFARRTKIRPLDDIDLMFCISGDGRSYLKNYDDTYYVTGLDSDKSNGLLNTDGTINSTKVINRFIKKLESLNDYRKAEMHKNQEAATLRLKSYEWNFDIVPCWYMDIDKFLIPDGLGNWKITDPRIDNDRTTRINQNHKGKILDLIRIMKYWNNRKITLKIGSYLLECMILDMYDTKIEKQCYWIDIELRDLLGYLSDKILGSVYDPKGIQGDLNKFSLDDRKKISLALRDAYQKACEAVMLVDFYKDYEASIMKWGEIFGSKFPCYS